MSSASSISSKGQDRKSAPPQYSETAESEYYVGGMLEKPVVVPRQ